MNPPIFRKPTKYEARAKQIKLLSAGYVDASIKRADDGYWEVFDAKRPAEAGRIADPPMK